MLGHKLKTLTLVTGGLSRPDLGSLIEMETTDRHPRVVFFADALNTDELDEKFLQRAPVWRRFFYRMLPVTAAQVIEALIIKNKYDAVISWAEKLGLPLAILMRITLSRVPHIGLFGWPAIGNKGRLLKHFHHQFDRIIMWSTVQRDKVIRELGVPASKIVLIKWPVDQQFFRPMSKTIDMICAVGSEMRDYPTLIEAMRGLPIKCHVAAGTLIKKNTRWERAVQNQSKLPDNVTVGRKDPLEIRELYARSRFVVIPLHETETDNGITCILEAFAMGKPVICSRTQGQVDVIEDGRTGIFVPVGDSTALNKAIAELWNNPERAEEMGRNARAYIEEHATLDRFVQRVREIVEDCVSDYPSGLNPENGASSPPTNSGPKRNDVFMTGIEKNIPVLMYHRVCKADERDSSKYVVNAATFREQLRYFKEQGYRTVKLGDILGNSNGSADVKAKSLLITFDDGYLDTFENALPALRDYGFTAIVFVVADLSRRSNWWDAPKQIAEARLMEPQHMIEMSKYGIEFGSHGITHRSLPLLSNEDLESELRNSQKIIEDILGQPVPYFAYPYGEVNERVKNATIGSGYDCAFASNSGPLGFHTDLFEIRRVLVANHSNSLYLYWKLSGLSKTFKWGEWIGKKVIGKQPAYTL